MLERWAVPLGALLFLLTGTSIPGHAQDTTPGAGAPGVITGGSASTSIGGQAAARRGDATDAGSAIVEGSKNVFIDGKPAAVLGDRTNCGGITIGGAGNVFINGKPAARAGDLTTPCPGK
ncbi:MAG TPA: PAAR domain-containing protein [Hyphomicrobiaceae bacterium]|nr:PAAR domain-containing protein [Hyphomicrobiaceae bacterium]